MTQKTYSIVGSILIMTLSILQADNIPDPCNMLTHQEIEKIMNIPMKEGKSKDYRNIFGGLGCNYGSINMFEKSGSVSITIDTTKSMEETGYIWESAKERFDKEKYAYKNALKRRNKASTFHKIKGIGEDAYWNHSSLKILNKDTYIYIRVNAGAGMSASNSEELHKKVDAKNLSVSKKIAQRILEKLKH